MLESQRHQMLLEVKLTSLKDVRYKYVNGQHTERLFLPFSESKHSSAFTEYIWRSRGRQTSCLFSCNEKISTDDLVRLLRHIFACNFLGASILESMTSVKHLINFISCQGPPNLANSKGIGWKMIEPKKGQPSEKINNNVSFICYYY